jgi:hypothetical protein
MIGGYNLPLSQFGMKMCTNGINPHKTGVNGATIDVISPS